MSKKKPLMKFRAFKNTLEKEGARNRNFKEFTQIPAKEEYDLLLTFFYEYFLLHRMCNLNQTKIYLSVLTNNESMSVYLCPTSKICDTCK